MLKSLSYRSLIFPAIVLGLAPFFPEPHLFQKIMMLKAGTLTKPIDIFDLVLHGGPIAVIIIKFVSDILGKKGASNES